MPGGPHCFAQGLAAVYAVVAHAMALSWDSPSIQVSERGQGKHKVSGNKVGVLSLPLYSSVWVFFMLSSPICSQPVMMSLKSIPGKSPFLSGLWGPSALCPLQTFLTPPCTPLTWNCSVPLAHTYFTVVFSVKAHVPRTWPSPRGLTEMDQMKSSWSSWEDETGA